MAVTQGRDPGAVCMLAQEHHRLGADPPGAEDMRDSTSTRVMRVADRGFSSKENRGNCAAVAGTTSSARAPLGLAEPAAALSRQAATSMSGTTRRSKRCGSPRTAVRDLLQPRTSRPGRGAARDHDRQAHRAYRRHQHLSATKRAELRGGSTMPGLHRFLRTTPVRLLRIDREDRGRGEPGREVPAALLGPDLSAEDIALGYNSCCRSNAAGGT